jgi:hypothetical protein
MDTRMLTYVGIVEALLGRPDNARRFFERILRATERPTDEASTLHRADAYNNLAYLELLLYASGRPAQLQRAIAYADQATTIYAEANDLAVVSSLGNRLEASVLSTRAEEVERALQLCVRTCQSREQRQALLRHVQASAPLRHHLQIHGPFAERIRTTLQVASSHP